MPPTLPPDPDADQPADRAATGLRPAAERTRRAPRARSAFRAFWLVGGMVFLALLLTAHSCDDEHGNPIEHDPRRGPAAGHPHHHDDHHDDAALPIRHLWPSGNCRACPVGEHSHGSGCHETTPGHHDVLPPPVTLPEQTCRAHQEWDPNAGQCVNTQQPPPQPHDCTVNQAWDPVTRTCEWNFQDPENASCPANMNYDETSRLCIPDPDFCDLIQFPNGCDPDSPHEGKGRRCPDLQQTVGPDGNCYTLHLPDEDRSEHCPAGETFYSQLGCRPPCPPGQTFVPLELGSNLGTCQATQQIINPPTTTVPGTLPELSVAGETVNELDGSADFTIALSPTASATVTVNVATSDGTGSAGSDYTAVNRTATIAAGSTTAVVSVTVLDDSATENDEWFTLTLSNPSNANLAACGCP